MCILECIVPLKQTDDKMNQNNYFRFINKEWKHVYESFLKRKNLILFKKNKRNDLCHLLKNDESCNVFDSIFLCNKMFFRNDPDQNNPNDQNIFKYMYH